MASVFPVIEMRHSVRSYSRYTLAESDVEKLENLFSRLPSIDQALKLSWKLKTSSPVGSAKLYAPLAESHPGAWVEYGFQGEALVLKLTQAGFGTCWIAVGGATEKNSPAVIVFGKEAKTGLAAFVTGAFLRARRRKDLNDLLASGSDYPTSEERRVLEAMRAAPSAVNKQPWRFTVRGENAVEVKRTGGHPVWTYLDLGIVLCHGYLTALEVFGSAAVTRLDEDRYEIGFTKTR